MTKQPITKSSEVVASQNQVATQLGDEVVILGVDAGQYFGLNEVGAKVWSLVQQKTTVGAICAAIQAEYEVAPDVCERDVLELLSDMQDRGLIHVAAREGAP
jgi:hypothetical protein